MLTRSVPVLINGEGEQQEHGRQQLSLTATSRPNIQVSRALEDEVAWVIEPLLLENECQDIIDLATKAGVHNSTAAGDKRHRNCCSHYFKDQQLSQRIWERLRECDGLPTARTGIEFKPEHQTKPPIGFRCDNIPEMLGQWTASGVNPQFTLLYYTPGGHFGPHRDGYKVLSEHERSLLTVAIYLNARFDGSGGATQFLQDEMDLSGPDETGKIQAPHGTVRASVEGDSVGKAVVFWHDMLHQGQPLDEDSHEPKWLLVTQILFQRDPSSAPQYTEDERMAREWLKQAEEAEQQRNVPEAIRLYNKAYRLDPSLE